MTEKYDIVHKRIRRKYDSRENLLHLAVLGDIYYKSACRIEQLEADLGLDRKVIDILLSDLKETGLIQETTRDNITFYVLEN